MATGHATSHPDIAKPARVTGRVSLALADIKLAHSVFALPFALLGAVLVLARQARAGLDGRTVALEIALVVLCMVSARTFAMLVNRLADRRLDAANPRTAGRAFARGALSARDGAVMLAASAGVFVLGAAGFGWADDNWWPLGLSLPVLAWIALYSYTKRFTWWCHVFLGGALGASPLAAALAVGGMDALLDAHAVWWLAGMVVCWVAGFDVIYALQDLEHDRSAGLNSVPARFGWRGAAWISRLLHAGALACLALAWLAEPRFGWAFLGGSAIVGALLAWEHALLARRGRAGIPMAFFTLNGVVSVVLGLAGAADAIW
ncbi:MAG: 4-hydroxybenzoate octaprenyltransferase [Phycisphaerales bacterium JB040]